MATATTSSTTNSQTSNNGVLNVFRKNRIAIELMLTDTINYTVNTFNQGRANFTVASAYGQIIFVLHNLAQLILYFIEDSITELNINTATRANSVYGLASLAGHNPTRAIAATGAVNLSLAGNALQAGVNGGVVVIPNFTTIKCTNNGVQYLVDLPTDQINLSLSSGVNGTQLNIVQGLIETQQFTGTGTPLQIFSCISQQSATIDNFNVNVYVNGERWKKFDSLYDIPKDYKGYLVRTSITGGGIDVIFGNSFFGLIPDLGNQIIVEYLVTSGGLGNIQLELDQTVQYTWVDSGFDSFGNEVDLNSVFTISNAIPPSFGANPEPLTLTRIVAPRTSRSYVLATPDNYITFMEKFNVFSIIDAYTAGTTPKNTLSKSLTSLLRTGVSDDNVVFLFLIPDVSLTMLSNQTYFNIPESQFTLTSAQQQQILNLIFDSGSQIVSTVVQFVNPKISRYVLNIAIIMFDGFDENTVNQEILKRLSDYFISIRRRDRIPRSDIITILENIDGIDTVNISFVSQLDETAFIQNSTSPLTHIDQFGDIIILKDELPIIRGGWTDRNGIQYEADINPLKPSSVNIVVSGVVPVTYNTTVNQTNINTIRGNS